MRLHINSELQIPSLKIKKMSFDRIDEEYKSICHFTYEGIYYVIPYLYEVYSISFKLEDHPEDFHLLYVLDFGKYKGSYKTALKKELSAKFPETWDKDVIRDWCDKETGKVLALCRVMP